MPVKLKSKEKAFKKAMTSCHSGLLHAMRPFQYYFRRRAERRGPTGGRRGRMPAVGKAAKDRENTPKGL